MTDLQSWVAPTCTGLADLLSGSPDLWEQPSLCELWQVRHVVAHVTMPARLTPEQYGAEMAAAGGDFTVLSNTVAERDGALPTADLLGRLRSPDLHAWQPPGGGAGGALSHAVIHSLDVTLAVALDPVAPPEALAAVLELLIASGGTWFGVDPAGVRPGDDAGTAVALLAGRTLPDGRCLSRAS
ncbi:maleylpyruvate isomerase N-terminal domain-containing protein [Nocardioides marmoribigeumensis]|uniref:Uncharacterized protein (TIGR03083 family) n=1 Tax=Nocardioides marmoribigeumensis TaxID=433649 RepID=A0ABU2C198_9ACTN|nr:maleylpyruvate isomerase N-terminal domain-containing protein [Nocardioides marmoribigeumensis]MDR7364359.1 uncharacterized protein (TIGR03083 family) [Nocardioides marmoribigeumensis]